MTASRLTAIDVAFAERVHDERMAKGLSENALAHMLPAPLNRQTTVSRITRGLRTVTVGEAFAISSTLGFPLSYFQPPLACGKYLGTPPDGFTCNDCGAAA